jgi:hypothetical protein
MFSIMTMASSTTKPVAMVSAMIDRLLRLKPARYITASVPISDSGTDRLGMSVARQSPRKRKITATTSTTAKVSSICTSRTEARMVTVRSVRTVTSSELGRVSRNCGSNALMRSTTSMTLAPGWRWTLMITAWVEFIQAASRLFSCASATVATSDTRTGAPLR